MRYSRECGGAITPMDRATAPKSYEYMVEFTEKVRGARAERLDSRGVLLGKAPQIIEALKRMEEIGFDEIILYFGVGLKPHTQVKAEMARFMEEVAPAFKERAISA